MQHFFVSPEQVKEEKIYVEGGDVNHMKNVLRMKTGEELTVNDGEGSQYLCAVESYEADMAVLKILEKKQDESELASKIYLFQGLPKQDKMELIVQKSVELGAYQVIPVATKRAVVKLDAKKAKKKIERWQQIAVSAAKQAGRGIIPEVGEVCTYAQALKQAEEGSRAKSSFLFAMSHDLRTPMNAIIGYTALMEKHWGEKEVTAGYLQKLKEAGNFLMDLIGNILEVARIESGKETLTETAWNLCNLEDTLDLLLDRDIYKKQLTLKKNMELQHPKVYCDVLKIQEITMNLLSNAVKYTPEGGTIHFTIRELPYEREGYALFQTVVEDTGIGISKEYIPHLFEAFSREKSSSESGIIGTGLGLRIVKKFVDLMEGSIVVESEIGEGTRFTVTIPHRIATANEYISEENAKELPEEIKLNNVRILLAEDNMLNAEIAMTLLADANAYVELAPDGEKALSMLKRATDGYYDLIIMDIQMPHMNGYEATKNIRGLPDGRCRIPIIAMTANAFEEDRKRAIESGMNGYVTKPIKIEELISTIKKILKS